MHKFRWQNPGTDVAFCFDRCEVKQPFFETHIYQASRSGALHKK